MTLVFLSALVIAFSGAMMPGPLLTYTIKQALHTGIFAGFIVIVGHAALELLLIALIFLGFDAILQSNLAQIAIGLIGGALLIYMGFDMIIGSAKNKISIQLDENKSNTGNILVSGFLLSAANPYFILWWAIIGLGFLLQAYKSFGVAGVLLFYSGHVLADFIWYGFISIAVGTTRKFMPLGLYRTIIASLGVMLIYFGCSFVYGSLY